MNKNIKYLFLLATLVILLAGLTALSATDVSDNSTTQQDTITTPASSINNVENVQTDNKVQNTVKDNKASVDKKTVKKETKKIKQETKTETVTDYESLKRTWNNIETNGTSDTEYTVNVKNGEYKFTERLILNDTNTTRVNVIGEDVDKTIFSGQNSTRLFFLNKTKLNVTFKNITFKDVFVNESSSWGGAAITALSVALNVDNCKFDSIYNGQSRSGAVSVVNSMWDVNNSITNSVFTNNYADGAGAISKGGNTSLVIDNCIFDNNSGAIHDTSGPLNITNSTFHNNHGKIAGAIEVDSITDGHSPIRVVNCLFLNNTGNNSIINIDSSSMWSMVDPDVLFNYTYFEGKADTSMYVNSTLIHVENNIVVLANGKSHGATFTQNDKTLILKATALGQYNDHEVSNIGAGYIIPVTTTSNHINTTNLVLSPSNNYTTVIDLTKLPANFKNFTVSVDGIEVASVACKKTDISIKPVTARTGNTITLNAIFTENGMPIEKGKVAFKINGKTIGHSDVSFGRATLTYKVPLYSAKKYTINVVYGGNEDYNEARVNTTLTLTKLSSKSVITTSNTVTNSKMHIKVKTIGINNKTVNGGKIAVKINGKTIKVLKTNGTVTVDFNVPRSWNNRNITVSTAYSGNGIYTNSRDTVNVVIKQEKNNVKSNSLKREDAENNYYVSTDNGSDSNTGSQTSPFKTIVHAISVVNNSKTSANIYLSGRFTGIGNTNLTVPGDLHINFIGLNNASIDGELNYSLKGELNSTEYYWGSSKVWQPYVNGIGNWAMNITRGNGLITISNLTITRCWNPGGSNIGLYKTATVDNYGNLKVDNVSFIYNCGGVGAGIRNNNGSTLTVTNSLFDANRKSESTGNYGAGIYNNGTAIIINSIFRNNYARWGTVTNDKVLTIINSTIRDNIGYDGGSTFKAGSGITINTGETDFYNMGSVKNVIETVIDGCTFINNDQLDVYADKGDLNLTNNVFNKSTGIYIPSVSSLIKDDMNIHINIKNNTINSPVASTIGTSLSTSEASMLVVSLGGKYNYTIEGNSITNIAGKDSYSIEIRVNHAIIKNNTFTRQMRIYGSYNTIINNNITTKLDEYAIILNDGAGYNNITNNYLVATSVGNIAVDDRNSRNLRNLIKNNTPEVVSIDIDDDTYNKYFDTDGNLLPDFAKIEQVRITGTLTNKNINVNKTLKITQINKILTSYNITITTTSTGKLESNLLKIINNNKRPVYVLNSDNNDINGVNLHTNAQYTIIVNGVNNTITGSQLISDILVGNESVQAPTNNNIKSNTPTYKVYVLSDDTYSQYFNTNGTIKELTVDRDIHFIVNGTLSNKDIILDNNRTITIRKYNNPQLVNVTITTEGTTNLNMSNITIINTNNKPEIILNTPKNTIQNNTIKTNANAINAINSKELTIQDNTIQVNSTENVTAISIKGSNFKTISGGLSNIIKNNIIEVTGPATPVNNEGRTGTTGIEILNSTGLSINNNNITVKYNNIKGSNDTIISLNIIESPYKQRRYVKIDIGNNYIYTYGNNYAYGVNIVNQTIDLSRNIITTEAKTLAVGIQLYNTTSFDSGQKGFFRGLISSDIISQSPSIGVIVNTCNNITIYENNFLLSGINSTGLLINNSTIAQVNKNIFTSNGNITAIKIKQSSETDITNNTINTQNTMKIPIELINTTNTEIKENNIVTTSNYTIHIDKNSYENAITNNTLYAKHVADTSILKENKNNRVRDNNPLLKTKYYLNDETYTQYFNSNGTLRNEVPEKLILQVTGELHSKTLNITRPINIKAEKINFINTNMIITGDNINITGISFTGENNKIIINGNNNNIQVTNFKITDSQTRNLTPIIITGNNNTFTIDTVNMESTVNYTSNITVITIKGDNNIVTINNTENHGLNMYYYNNFTGIKVVNANNNRITYYISNNELRNVNDILLTNSNNNTINITRRLERDISVSYNGIKLINSSNNNITGEIRVASSKKEIPITILTLEENSNNNIIDSLDADLSKDIKSYRTKDPSVHIYYSHNNIIRYSSFLAGENYTIEIIESVGNSIEYNRITRGDMGVIQENMNETVNNNVKYNNETKDGGGSSLLRSSKLYLDLIMPDTVKIGDTITIIANITYRNRDTFRKDFYQPITDGILTIEINGIAHDYLLKDGRIILNYTYIDVNYTVNDYNNGKINIRAIYKDQNRYYATTIHTGTIFIQKNETQVSLGNFTNNGMTSIITAITTDDNGNMADNGTITFKANDEVIGTVTIINKVAILPVNIANYKPGVYNLTATYNGNDYYLPSTGAGLLTVNKCKVTASITPVTVKSGETVTLTSIIKDVNGNLVDNGIAVFKLNNKTLKDEFGENIYAQVHNGIASINYTIPDNYSAKDYNLTVVTSGDAYKRVENTTKLTITKHNAQILLEPQNITRTNNTNFKIELVDENGNPITGSTKVAIKFNGKTQLHTRATNGVIDFNMDLTNYKHNSYELSIVIAGNSLYNNTRATNMLFLK